MSGSGFNLADEGLLVEAYLSHGDDFVLLRDNYTNVSMQTQTAYSGEEDEFVFAHPFEYHFRCKGSTGWPKLMVKAWRVDEMNRVDNIAYGQVSLPNQVGSFDLEVPTWRPMASFKEEAYNFYLGTAPKLTNSDPVVRNPE